MPTEKTAPKPAPKSLQELGLENFVVREINRKDLKDAPYNPRVMADAEKRKLKQGLKKHGMVAPPTYNKRTQHIVGGHQRLSQLDSLAGTDHYTLQVAEIDVDETREKEINLLLNSEYAQGSFEMEGLKKLLTEDKLIDLDATGFDRADVYNIFGENIWTDETNDVEKLREMAENVRKLTDQFNTMMTRIDARVREDFYMVVVFKDAHEREKFLKNVGLPNERYQSGDEIRRLVTEGTERPQKTDPSSPDTSKAPATV